MNLSIVTNVLILVTVARASIYVTNDTSKEKPFPCLSGRLHENGSPFTYPKMEDYVSDVCATCYSLISPLGLKMITYFNPRFNRTVVERPLLYFATYEGGLLMKQPEGGNFTIYKNVDPTKFNREIPNEDFFLQTFRTHFYLVSLMLIQLRKTTNVTSNFYLYFAGNFPRLL